MLRFPESDSALSRAFHTAHTGTRYSKDEDGCQDATEFLGTRHFVTLKQHERCQTEERGQHSLLGETQYSD